MKSYYVAFYDKNILPTPASTPLPSIITDPTQTIPNSTPNSTLKDQLFLNPSYGFLLAYDPAGRGSYYLWDPNQNRQNNGAWVDITGQTRGKEVCGLVTCNPSNLYYTVYPGNAFSTPKNFTLPNTWTILFDQGFGSKSMYTAVQVVNSNNQTAINPNASPVP